MQAHRSSSSLPAFGEWEVRPNNSSFSGEFKLAREKRNGFQYEDNLGVAQFPSNSPEVEVSPVVQPFSVSSSAVNFKTPFKMQGLQTSIHHSFKTTKLSKGSSPSLFELLGFAYSELDSPACSPNDFARSSDSCEPGRRSASPIPKFFRSRDRGRSRPQTDDKENNGRKGHVSCSPFGAKSDRVRTRKSPFSRFISTEKKPYTPASSRTSPDSKKGQRGRSRDSKSVIEGGLKLLEKYTSKELPTLPRISSLRKFNRSSSTPMSPHSRFPQFGVWDVKDGLTGADIAEKFELLTVERRVKLEQRNPATSESDGTDPDSEGTPCRIPRSQSMGAGLSKRRSVKVPSFGHWENEEGEQSGSVCDDWSSESERSPECANEWRDLLLGNADRVSSTGEQILPVWKQRGRGKSIPCCLLPTTAE